MSSLEHDLAETVYINNAKRRSRIMLGDTFNRIATLHDVRAYFIPNLKALVVKLFHQRVLIEASLKRASSENGLLTLLLTRPEITQTWMISGVALSIRGICRSFSRLFI